MHSPDHSTKGTPSALGPATGQWPLTAREYVVSGSLSSPSRGAFHLSLTVLVHYRSLEVFSLGEWSPQLPTRFHVSRGTQDPDPIERCSPYETLTLFGPAFQRVRVFVLPCCQSYNPGRRCQRLVWALPGSLATTTGISVDFFSSGY
jgi:hypothetical protein